MVGPPGRSAGGGAAAKDKDVQICFDFTKGLCARGESCRFSHDLATIVTVNSQERGICFDFVRGQCNRGLLCRFSHDLSNLSASSAHSTVNNNNHKPPAPPATPSPKPHPSSAICYDFVKGACARSDCRYSHDLTTIAGSRERGTSTPPTAATTTAPNVEICYDHTRGRCTRGSACRYAHSVPTPQTIARTASGSSTSSGAPGGPTASAVGSGEFKAVAPPRPPSRDGSASRLTPSAKSVPHTQQTRVAVPSSGVRYADILGSRKSVGSAQQQALQVPQPTAQQQQVQAQQQQQRQVSSQQPLQQVAWQQQQVALQTQLEGMTLDQQQQGMMFDAPRMQQGGPPVGFSPARLNASGFEGSSYDGGMMMGGIGPAGMGIFQQNTGRMSGRPGSMLPLSQQQQLFAQQQDTGRSVPPGAQQSHMGANFSSAPSQHMMQQQSLQRPPNFRPPPTPPAPAWPGDRVLAPGARPNPKMGAPSPVGSSSQIYNPQSQADSCSIPEAMQNGNGVSQYAVRAPPANGFAAQQMGAMQPRQNGLVGRQPLPFGAQQHAAIPPDMHDTVGPSMQFAAGQSRTVAPWGSQQGATTNMNSNMLGQLRQIWQS